jgi:cytochrome c553
MNLKDDRPRDVTMPATFLRAKKLSHTISWVAIATLLTGSVASVQAAPPSGPAVAATGETIANSGVATGAMACAVCHGATGQGQSAAGFPRLAGMNADYLVHQLTSFNDASRVSPVMAPLAKLLTASDQRAVADYYAALPISNEATMPPSETSAKDASAIDAGKVLALNGNWSKGVPACVQCHGVDGWGVGAAFPQISGQSATYLKNQLHAWQQGARKNDPMALMRGIALKLTDADISNVATYYASQPVTSPKRSNKP